MFLSMYIYVCVCARTCAGVHVFMCAPRVHVCMDVCIYVSVYVSVYVYMHVYKDVFAYLSSGMGICVGT